MTIARTAAAIVGAGIARSSTPSYTVGAASTLLVAVISSTVQPSAVSYGGSAMTIASKEDTFTNQWTTLAYLLSPPTGANNFAFTISAGSISVMAADYSGVAAADGSAVTNYAAAASQTTNVALAQANEWVVAGGISGHLTNVFQNTSNLTVAAQDNTFLTCALMDTAGGVGSGTIGFVTTVNGSSYTQAVVCQAFEATASGTTVTADAGAALESLATQHSDPGLAAEWSGNLAIDRSLPGEGLASVRRGGSYGGLGAVYGPALAYWGLRALDEAAAAAGLEAIQLQRASDNATLDIGVLPSGALDLASAAAFLAGTTGGISIWYDQSGNGYHMIQTTAALQPQFQFAATPDGQPGVVFTAANSTVLRYDAGIPNQTAPLLCAAFVNPTAIGSSPDSVYVDSALGGNQGFQNEGGTDSWVVSFYSLNYVTAGVGWHSAQAALAVGTNASDLHLDGVQNLETYSFTGSNVLLGGPDAIGADTSGVGSFHAYFTGAVAEIGWFATAATNAELDAGYADQQAAWVTGYPAPGGVLLEAAAALRADPGAELESLASGTTIAGDAAVRLEFAARAAGDMGARLESLAAPRGDSGAAGEFAATVRGDPGLAAAFLRRQAADPPTALESLAAQRSETPAPAEFAAVRQGDTAVPAALLRRQQADPGTPAETLGGLARDRPAPVENTGAVAVAGNTLVPSENLRRQSADPGLSAENLAALRGDPAIASESLGTLRRDDALWLEVLAGVLRDAGLPAEWQGGTLAIADAALRLEFLGTQRAEPGLPLEFKGGVAVAVLGDSGLPLETGGVVRAEVWAAAEIAAGVVAEARFPAELLIAARADNTLPAAALLRVQADPAAPAEWLGQALSVAEALVPVEIEHSVVVATRGPNEALADVVQVTGGATETMALLLRDPPVPAEITARLLGTSATLPEQSQAIVRMAAGGPVEWEAPPMLLVSLSRLLASIGRRRILKE